jgi:two-component system cell cycle sensor histidine kinase/response regulator CckA
MAFVRPAASAPSIVNLADLIVQLDPLLRRLVGVRVELVTLAAPDLGGVRLAPGPFEQVLMNLVANARDATDKGGKITIATRNATVDASSIHRPPACPPGEYVVVSVRDTGSGMDDETLTHIFEPFFTTKPPGQGTGLGLATCYAIVMQSGGHFRVESAPGCGTTVEIYWPRLPLGAITEPSACVPETRAEGHETILVVEDEPAVRALAIEALRQQGYAVLDAENGEHALGVVAAHDGAIDLLVTDIVMPRLGGRELARRLLAERPGLRVLFMSGYIEDNAFLHEVEGGGAAFLQKPFMPQTLTVKVREVLETGTPRSAPAEVVSA